MPFWESPLNTHSSDTSSNFISCMELILSQLLNLKDMVSDVFAYKMGAMKWPTRKGNSENHIALYNMVLSLVDHTHDQFLLKFFKHFQCLKHGWPRLPLYNILWNLASIGSYMSIVYLGRFKDIYKIECGFIVYYKAVHSIDFKCCSCLLIDCEPTIWIGIFKKGNQCNHHWFYFLWPISIKRFNLWW